MSHPIVHIEYSTRDQEETSKFFKDLFGWEYTYMEEMDYTTFEAEGGPGGGYTKLSDMVSPGTIYVYVNTDDVTGTLEKAVSLGAEMVMPKTEIPTVGWFGFFKDLTGNMIGLYQPLNPEE